MNILHVITGLEIGGAEMMLYRLLGAMRKKGHTFSVISLSSGGALAQKIEGLGVPVYSANMSPLLPNPLGFVRLATLMRGIQPDLIHTWMYHADLLGSLGARLAGLRSVPILWGIHNSGTDIWQTRWLTRAVIRWLATLSWRVPQRIVCCSSRALDFHVARGYDRERMMVIPNGFDLDIFSPSKETRQRMRAALGVKDDEFLIGKVARFHPQKDFPNFIRAAARVAEAVPNARFIIAGTNVTAQNRQLVNWIAAQGLLSRFILAGERNDIPDLMNALDLYSMTSSFGEAFPLTVGEAMACEVPCVVTDVGDAAEMVGDSGVSVPPRDSGALAAAWIKFAERSDAERRALGIQARKRIETRYALPKIAAAYQELYSAL